MTPLIACICLFVFGAVLLIVGACTVSDAYEIPRQPWMWTKHDDEEYKPTVSQPVLVWPVKRKVGLVIMWIGVANMLPALVVFWVRTIV